MNSVTALNASEVRAAYGVGLDVCIGCVQPGEGMDDLRRRLEGYVHQLLLEVEELAVRMLGETRQTAMHVVLRACDLLQEHGQDGGAASAGYIHDLAVVCRALLALYEQPGQLGPVLDDEIAAVMHTRVCRECSASIPESERVQDQPGVSGEGDGPFDAGCMSGR